MSLYRCPVCGRPLVRGERTYRCPGGHCYDIAKEGYSKAPGDDKAMTAARGAFLSKGYYDFLRHALCALAVTYTPDVPAVLDVGCGEGYYTAAICEALTAAGKAPRTAGIDISKVVRQMQKAIRAGEIFQVVPSRRFSLPCPSPLAAYDVLKKSNPSPYMFFMQDNDFTLFGASPESSLKYDATSRQIEIYPIAGTRPRGRRADGSLDRDLDSRIELEMRTDHKELSEHLMLVDLARNDLARICTPGSRYVADLTKVDRYSFVMHLVSRVVGELRHDLDVLHAYRACMNMGTLSGAPKVRAMQLIAEAEGRRRGSYGGAVGYFTAHGDLDTCIVIRSAYVEDGIATVQAGAGIVLDSVPQSEADETRSKARAVLRAIATAHHAQEIF